MFEECLERFYGISSDPNGKEEEANAADDIESSIKKEVSSMNDRSVRTEPFSPIRLDVPCVLFFKVKVQINPVEFVHRICKEVVSTPRIKRLRYVNRLTPMSLMGKATEKGLDDLCKTVLKDHFQLRGQGEYENQDKASQGQSACSYAIRPSIRNHGTLNRDTVITQIASLIGEKHKVDLTKPEKVIIVEIYQTVCGMSVVGSDWDGLKRFNLAELYQLSPKSTLKGEAMPQIVTTNDAEPKPHRPTYTNGQET